MLDKFQTKKFFQHFVLLIRLINVRKIFIRNERGNSMKKIILQHKFWLAAVLFATAGLTAVELLKAFLMQYILEDVYKRQVSACAMSFSIISLQGRIS